MTNRTELKTPTGAQNDTESRTVAIGIAPNRKSTHWKNKTYSIDELFNELRVHRALEDKNKASLFTQGSLLRSNYNRGNDNAADVNLFVLDIDNKIPDTKAGEHYTIDDDQHVSLDNAKTLVKASGFKAIIYTSHSHSEETHRFRVVLPMAHSYALDSKDAKDKWEFFYQAMSAALGFIYDKSGERFSQAFYMPSCPQERADIARSFAVNEDGGLIDWNDYEDAATALEITTSYAPTERKDFMYEGFPLRIWYEVYGETYDVVRALELYEGDVIGKQNNDGGYCLTPCPFHEESEEDNPSESKTAIYNPDGNGGKFGFNCEGAHCVPRKHNPLEYLLKMLQEGWLMLERLKDPAFGGGGIDPVEEAEGTDKSTTAERVKQIMHLVKVDGRATVNLNVRKRLLKNKTWTTTDLNRLEKEITVEIKKSRNKRNESVLNKALAKMNEEFIMVTMGNTIRYIQEKHGNTVFFRKSDFLSHVEALRLTIPTDDEDVIVPLGPEWLKWEQKRQADEVVMLPAPPNVKPKIEPWQYNLWRGFTVKPVKGDWSLMQWHILHIVCSGNKEHYHWIMSWLAHMFQQPQEKPETAIVLKGEKGTGKSIVADQIRKIVGDYHAFVASDQKHLTGNFNSHLKSCIFMQAEEAVWGGDKKGKGSLQHLITGDTVALEPKGIDTTNVANFTRVFMTTNEEHAIPTSHGERRYAFWEVSDVKMQNTTYFGALADQMNNGGRAAMLHDLLEYDWKADGVDVRTAPKTEALLKQIEQGEPLEIKWLKDILGDGGYTYSDNHYSVEWYLNQDENEKSLVSKDDVYNSYKLYVKEHARGNFEKPMAKNVFTTKLNEMIGAETIRLRENGVRVQKYVFPSLNDMADTMKRKFKHEVKRPEIVDEATANDETKSNVVDLSNLKTVAKRNKR